jgi:hypothetical protein
MVAIIFELIIPLEHSKHNYSDFSEAMLLTRGLEPKQSRCVHIRRSSSTLKCTRTARQIKIRSREDYCCVADELRASAALAEYFSTQSQWRCSDWQAAAGDESHFSSLSRTLRCVFN